MDMFRFTAIPKYERAMDVLAQRQRVIGHNVANMTTPGYKTKDIAFREELAGAMGLGEEDPYAVFNPQAVAMERQIYDRMEYTVASGRRRDAATDEALKEIRIMKQELYQDDVDGEGFEAFEVFPDTPAGVNDVQSDEEMAKMTETGILYRAFQEIARKKFTGIKNAISESV
jgi:flagellar basal-body rod protein FlgB